MATRDKDRQKEAREQAAAARRRREGSGSKNTGVKAKNIGKKQPNYTGKKDQTGRTMTKQAVRKKTAARIKADKPNLKGKALKTRINKQTKAGIARRRQRGMKVTK